jgi:uncharacterized protein
LKDEHQKDLCCRTRYVARNPLGILPVSIDDPALQAFCERCGVAELELFGSVLRDDFRPDSDIDAVVSFLEDRRPALLMLVEIEEELR